jgi:hypothetical protein
LFPRDNERTTDTIAFLSVLGVLDGIFMRDTESSQRYERFWRIEGADPGILGWYYDWLQGLALE